MKLQLVGDKRRTPPPSGVPAEPGLNSGRNASPRYVATLGVAPGPALDTEVCDTSDSAMQGRLEHDPVTSHQVSYGRAGLHNLSHNLVAKNKRAGGEGGKVGAPPGCDRGLVRSADAAQCRPHPNPFGGRKPWFGQIDQAGGPERRGTDRFPVSSQVSGGQKARNAFVILDSNHVFGLSGHQYCALHPLSDASFRKRPSGLMTTGWPTQSSMGTSSRLSA